MHFHQSLSRAQQSDCWHPSLATQSKGAQSASGLYTARSLLNADLTTRRVKSPLPCLAVPCTLLPFVTRTQSISFHYDSSRNLMNHATRSLRLSFKRLSLMQSTTRLNDFDKMIDVSSNSSSKGWLMSLSTDNIFFNHFPKKKNKKEDCVINGISFKGFRRRLMG